MNNNINNLIARVLSGNGSDDDQLRLDLWLAQSDENRKAFQTFKQIWDQSVLLKKDVPADVEAAWVDFQQRIEARPKRANVSALVYLRAAAGLALLAVLAVIINYVMDEGARSETLASLSKPIPARALASLTMLDTLEMDEDSTEFYTPDTTLQIKRPQNAGKQLRRRKNVVLLTYTTQDTARAFYLPDQSIVFLNEHSTLVFEEGFGKNNRKLNLSGEAYFEVAQDSIPFSVSCGKTLSQTNNGFFNLRETKAQKEVEVITASGQVEFSGVGNHQYRKLKIETGERALFNENKILVKEENARKDYKWWQKKGLRAKLRSLLNKIKNTFK